MTRMIIDHMTVSPNGLPVSVHGRVVFHPGPFGGWGLSDEIKLWLRGYGLKIEAQIDEDNDWFVDIPDPSVAMLFKLTWGGA